MFCHEDESVEQMVYELNRARMMIPTTSGSGYLISNTTTANRRVEQRNLPSVRISYQGNVVCCDRFRNSEDNLEFARSILIAIIGENPFVGGRDSDFNQFGGKIEYYTSY